MVTLPIAHRCALRANPAFVANKALDRGRGRDGVEQRKEPDDGGAGAIREVRGRITEMEESDPGFKRC
jgi:hypothetical protein